MADRSKEVMKKIAPVTSHKIPKRDSEGLYFLGFTIPGLIKGLDPNQPKIKKKSIDNQTNTKPRCKTKITK